MKYYKAVQTESAGRTSHEVRGLKSSKSGTVDVVCESHLTRGAWIEMNSPAFSSSVRNSRTSHEVRGLKYLPRVGIPEPLTSHLTRGAWIEITDIFFRKRYFKVAPHTRCVD